MNASSRPSSAGSRHRDGEYGVIDDLRTTSIFSSLPSLLFCEKFSDMTIRCGGREFKAHRAIVCTQSPFFDKAFTSGFTETDTGVIDLAEDDPDVLKCFLQFLYTGTYEDGVNSTWGKPSTVAMMSPQEISDSLGAFPGVPVMKDNGNQVDQVEASTAAPEPTNRGAAESSGNTSAAVPRDPAESDNETEDPDYQDSSGTNPEDGRDEEEPEEEYNEFGERGGYDSDEPDSPLRNLWRVGKGSKASYWGERDPEEVLHEFTELRQDLFLPLRLYIMADKYDVPALRLLARDRFYRAAEISWKTADTFPAVVDELYSCTPNTEIAMREIVCRLVGCSLHDDKLRQKMEPVMRKHGDFAVEVINYMLQSSRQQW